MKGVITAWRQWTASKPTGYTRHDPRKDRNSDVSHSWTKLSKLLPEETPMDYGILSSSWHLRHPDASCSYGKMGT